MSNEISSASCAEPQEATAKQFEASGADMVGQRLDYALTLLLPQMGLRIHADVVGMPPQVEGQTVLCRM